MDTWSMKDLIQTMANVLQGLGSFSIVVMLWIHYKERISQNNAEHQANRSRLTEAYIRFHSAILSSRSNIKVARKIWWRPLDLWKIKNHVDEDDQDELVNALHLLYLRLHVFYLEFKFRSAYSGTEDMNELRRTFDTAMKGLALNPEPIYQELLQHLPDLISGFDLDFQAMVLQRMKSLKDSADAEV